MLHDSPPERRRQRRLPPIHQNDLKKSTGWSLQPDVYEQISKYLGRLGVSATHNTSNSIVHAYSIVLE